ncbi:Rho-binding antiterminator [Motilimonas sp. KMU-193]|uniref:Rho-binding antiterminator n=1 Tax=Motilimonas sp. KMU-193 TaxID=3388668 RepID=UPI00396B16FF
MISCADYDYIEIVCMFQYPVALTLKSGAVKVGTAVDTAKNADREECIKIKVEDNHELVALDTIAKLEVLVANPHFKVVCFS